MLIRVFLPRRLARRRRYSLGIGGVRTLHAAHLPSPSRNAFLGLLLWRMHFPMNRHRRTRRRYWRRRLRNPPSLTPPISPTLPSQTHPPRSHSPQSRPSQKLLRVPRPGSLKLIHLRLSVRLRQPLTRLCRRLLRLVVSTHVTHQ